MVDEMNHEERGDAPDGEEASTKLGWTSPPNPVLARLIEEVRVERSEGPNVYNRFHNRHNRSR